jgi:glycosyltransferase involved in cell wall biosynthesis
MERTESTPRIAVVIPCFDEAPTIATVVRDFRTHLPDATVYVFDNASTDGSGALAAAAGAEVVLSPRRGKGNVLRHMGMVVDADVYVIVDGDGTYPAAAAPDMVATLQRERLDMLVGARLQRHAADGSFRPFHRVGNHLVSALVRFLFRTDLTDVLSGYRILSRSFVNVVRPNSAGFQVETEMTAQALTKRLSVAEIPVDYFPRPEGSVSKLSTYSDGFLIAKCIFLLFKDYRPLGFFSILAGLLAMASIVSGIGPIRDFVETGYVLRVPRAILAVGLGTLSIVFLTAGLILDTISKLHQETIELWKQVLRDRR